MKKVFVLAEKMLQHPVTNLLIAAMLIYGGVEQIMEDYKAEQRGIRVHHGIALYGVYLVFKSGIALVRMVHGFGKIHKQIHKDQYDDTTED